MLRAGGWRGSCLVGWLRLLVFRYALFCTFGKFAFAMTRLLNLPPALRFIAIGGSAAVVHLAVVRLVVDARWLVPAWANVLGWLVAFAVSFSGHFYWTFARQGTSLVQALPRFFLLSAAGFAINQAAYVLALRFVPWRYDVLLACVLVAVAVGTYVFSKLWAFKASAACKRP